MSFYEDNILGKSNKSQRPFLKPNILHQFASYTTMFTLSGITEKEIQEQSFLTTQYRPHDIIAQTGGITDANITGDELSKGTDGSGDAFDRIIKQKYNKFVEDYQDSIAILERGHDVFFENINMLSTVGPNAERNLANFTKMEFQIHEPYGVTFIEKVRAATALNGFQDYQDAPLLLTIRFKGFDENGVPSPVSVPERKIPILIVRVDFDVNEGGAQYNITAVPYTDMAFDDRFKFPRTTINVDAINQPAEWVTQVENKLKEQMEKERKANLRELDDEYKFIIDAEVKSRAGSYKETVKTVFNNVDDDFSGLNTDLETPDPKIKLANGKAETTTSLVKFFEDAIREAYGYQRLANDFWVTYLERANVIKGGQKISDKQINKIVNSDEFSKVLLENQYVDWFKIKTTVQTDTDKFDNITKMHKKKVIFRAMPYKVHILKLIKPGVSIKRLDFSRLVRKEYNYIYTGENTDVQNLRINYKSAYYMRNVFDAKAGEGIFGTVSDAWQKVFGAERYPEPTKQIRQYPSNLKNRSALGGTVSGEGQRAQEFYDYLTNPEADMIRVEMDILGDPAYICQDMYVPLDGAGNNKPRSRSDYDSESESFNADQVSPLILIRYRIPDDISDKDGLMFSKAATYRDEDLFFNGIYQVVKVESKFDNGQFLQTLTCVRMNNQQGEGAPAILQKAADRDFSVDATETNDNGFNTVKGLKERFKNFDNNRFNKGKSINEIIKKTGPGTSNPKNPRNGRG